MLRHRKAPPLFDTCIVPGGAAGSYALFEWGLTLFFKDVLSIWQWVGVFLVIASIILATVSKRKEMNKKTTPAHAS
ncbi:hypothetical protein [Halalkalibacter alkalisediminis]|uniref:Uncharacterized protein n=1 Tax=Halalkalibacter alkalisediminis TaxID=935616 RepID=A0ABV6NIT9_9BACI